MSLNTHFPSLCGSSFCLFLPFYWCDMSSLVTANQCTLCNQLIWQQGKTQTSTIQTWLENHYNQYQDLVCVNWSHLQLQISDFCSSIRLEWISSFSSETHTLSLEPWSDSASTHQLRPGFFFTVANMIHHKLFQECKTMSGYLSVYLGERAVEYLGGFFDFFIQDPVMPSQEPPSDAKSEEVDLPPDNTEDTDDSKTLKHFCYFSSFTCVSQRKLFVTDVSFTISDLLVYL